MIKLINILNEAEISKCPAPTQNIELNLQNRQKAINEYGFVVAEPGSKLSCTCVRFFNSLTYPGNKEEIPQASMNG